MDSSAPAHSKTRFLRTLLQVILAKLLAGGSAVAINLAMIRYMDTESFGLLGVCVALVLIADGVLGSALDIAVLKLAPGRDASSAMRLHSGALYMKLCFGFAITGILFVFGAEASQSVFRSSSYGRLMLCSAAAIVGMLLLRSAQVYAQASQEFGKYGYMDVAHGCLRMAGVAVLALTSNASPESVMAVFAIAPLLPFLLWASAHRQIVSGWRFALEGAPELWSTVKWLLVTFALASVVSRLDVVLVSRWGSLQDAGVYSAALVFAVMVQIAGSYIGVLLSPRISPALAEGSFYSLFRNVQLALFAAGGIAFLLFAVIWRFFGSLLLPAAYTQAGDVAHILMIGAIAGFVTFPLTLTFVMFVRPRFLFVMDCVTVPLFLAANYYAIPHFGAAGAAMVTAGANAGRAMIAQIFAWKWAREHSSPSDSAAASTPAIVVASPSHS